MYLHTLKFGIFCSAGVQNMRISVAIIIFSLIYMSNLFRHKCRAGFLFNSRLLICSLCISAWNVNIIQSNAKCDTLCNIAHSQSFWLISLNIWPIWMHVTYWHMYVCRHRKKHLQHRDAYTDIAITYTKLCQKITISELI